MESGKIGQRGCDYSYFPLSPLDRQVVDSDFGYSSRRVPDSDNLDCEFLIPDSVNDSARLADDFPDTRIVELGHDATREGEIP